MKPQSDANWLWHTVPSSQLRVNFIFVWYATFWTKFRFHQQVHCMKRNFFLMCRSRCQFGRQIVLDSSRNWFQFRVAPSDRWLGTNIFVFRGQWLNSFGWKMDPRCERKFPEGPFNRYYWPTRRTEKGSNTNLLLLRALVCIHFVDLQPFTRKTNLSSKLLKNYSKPSLAPWIMKTVKNMTNVQVFCYDVSETRCDRTRR